MDTLPDHRPEIPDLTVKEDGNPGLSQERPRIRRASPIAFLLLLLGTVGLGSAFQCYLLSKAPVVVPHSSLVTYEDPERIWETVSSHDIFTLTWEHLFSWLLDSIKQLRQVDMGEVLRVQAMRSVVGRFRQLAAVSTVLTEIRFLLTMQTLTALKRVSRW